MTLSFISRNALALLFDATLKATLVLALALLADRLLRRRSAAARHLVLVAALAAICVLPLAERVLPKIPTQYLASVLPAAPAPEVPAPQAAPSVTTAVETRVVEPPVKPARTNRVTIHQEATTSSTTLETSQSGATPAPATAHATTPQPSRWPLALFALWVAGVAFFGARVLVGIARLKGVLRHADAVEDSSWSTLLRRTCAGLGIRRPVTLLRSADLDVPITTGVVYPMVVLPPEAGEWPAARRAAVLNHELAHVKRLDALTQWIAQAALALHWFNPLVWVVVRQMRLEREQACDDFVLATGTRPSEYAHDLLEIVTQVGSKREYAVALAMARKSQFEGRLLALLDPRRDRAALSRAAVVLTAVLAAALVLPLAAMSPQQPPIPPQPPAPAAQPSQPTPPAVEAPSTPPPDETEPAVADAPEAQQPTPEPTPEALPAPAARPAEGATPRPAVAPEARSGSGYGYGYGYGSTPAVAGVPGVPAAPGSPASPAAPAALGGSGFPDPDCKSDSSQTHVSMSNNVDDSGYQTMSGSWTRGECTLRIHAAGKLVFNADATQLLGLGSEDGFFDVTESIGQQTRRVKVTPAGSGLKYEYWRNGTQQEMDGDAKAWFSRFLVAFERHTGYAANTRVPAILKQGGPTALLHEVAQIDSDYVASIYLRTMLEQVQLDPGMLRATLAQSGTQIHSDYEKARVLLVIAQKYPLADDASRSAFLAGADSLKSDYEHARVLIEFLKRPNLSREQVRMALGSASRLGSDYERARVLMTMLDARMVDASMQELFFQAANGIKSDYEHSRTLIGLLDHVSLNPQVVVRLLQATSTIGSDYERARVLTATAEKYPMTGPAKSAYLQAANGIRSEYERNRALAALSSSTRM